MSTTDAAPAVPSPAVPSPAAPASAALAPAALVLPDHFPSLTTDTIRYGDTDRQGHVNNAVFATYLETGRCHLLFEGGGARLRAGTAFVMARLELDYVAEVHWPGSVQIGTAVLAVGRSSVRLAQAVFQDGRCAARAETVVVLMDEQTRRSTPWTDAERAWLARWQVSGQPGGSVAAG